MFQVRIHGRGGQGVVTAAELLSVAAFLEGRHAQAFPSFGSERTGAPVVAFCRIDDRPIRVREPIAEPDALIVQDPTLLHQVDVFGGLRPDGSVLINTGAQRSPSSASSELVERFRPSAASPSRRRELAREHLGRPLPERGAARRASPRSRGVVVARRRSRPRSASGSPARSATATSPRPRPPSTLVRASEEPAHA